MTKLHFQFLLYAGTTNFIVDVMFVCIISLRI